MRVLNIQAFPRNINWRRTHIAFFFSLTVPHILQRPTMLKRAISTVYPTLYVTFYYPSMPNSLFAEVCERQSAKIFASVAGAE